MDEPKNVDQTLNLVKTISGFVSSLNDCFGTKQKTLQLYARLISKTTINDVEPISRHIDAFEKFCKENASAIMNKNHREMANPIIKYNEKVFINMELIFSQATTSRKTDYLETYTCNICTS